MKKAAYFVLIVFVILGVYLFFKAITRPNEAITTVIPLTVEQQAMREQRRQLEETHPEKSIPNTNPEPVTNSEKHANKESEVIKERRFQLLRAMDEGLLTQDDADYVIRETQIAQTDLESKRDELFEQLRHKKMVLTKFQEKAAEILTRHAKKYETIFAKLPIPADCQKDCKDYWFERFQGHPPSEASSIAKGLMVLSDFDNIAFSFPAVRRAGINNLAELYEIVPKDKVDAVMDFQIQHVFNIMDLEKSWVGKTDDEKMAMLNEVNKEYFSAMKSMLTPQERRLFLAENHH